MTILVCMDCLNLFLIAVLIEYVSSFPLLIGGICTLRNELFLLSAARDPLATIIICIWYHTHYCTSIIVNIFAIAIVSIIIIILIVDIKNYF